MTAVPLVVIGGYLGAGKTTLVNHLLRHAGGRRIAVLVNDFGAVSIDAALIEGASDGVLALAGGCVCCSFGDDLVGSLERLARREPPPDVMLLECSGVGLPGAVARSAALARGVAVQGVAVVVDAAELQRQAQDVYVGDTVRQQLADADLLLVNQADRCSAGQLASVQAELANIIPGVRQVAGDHANFPAAVVLGLHGGSDASREEAWSGTAGHMRAVTGTAGQQFRFYERHWPDPVDPPALARTWLAGEPGLLRAKGVLRGLDGRLWVLQVMGRRFQVEPLHDTEIVAVGRIVCIAAGATST